MKNETAEDVFTALKCLFSIHVEHMQRCVQAGRRLTACSYQVGLKYWFILSQQANPLCTNKNWTCPKFETSPTIAGVLLMSACALLISNSVRKKKQQERRFRRCCFSLVGRLGSKSFSSWKQTEQSRSQNKAASLKDSQNTGALYSENHKPSKQKKDEKNISSPLYKIYTASVFAELYIPAVWQTKV